MTRSLALVTGASSGIGLELAKNFADNDYDLVVCAEDDIDEAAVRIGGGVEMHTVQADLRTRDGVDTLYAALSGLGRPLDAAALNAGVGEGGAFVDQDLEDILSIVNLNIVGTTYLARLLLADMVKRNAGRLLVTSSIASLMPGSYQAVYNASKSYLQSLIEALQTELADTEVTLTALMPGPTDTEFFERADMASGTRIGEGSKDNPAEVAAQGFAALMSGKRRVVGGSIGTKAQYVAGTLLPDRMKAAMHAVMAKPRT